MLRNQQERHEGPDGRWAEVSGAADSWLLEWSGGPTLDYRSAATARAAALEWTERGLDPRRAVTLRLDRASAPAGSWS